MKFFFKHVFIKFEFGQEIFQDEKNYLKVKYYLL